MRATGLFVAWGVMLALLALSVGSTFLAIGPWRQAISLGIAAIKAGIILWLFMELRRADGLVRLAALGTVAFLAILMILLGADYLTRGWLVR